MTDGNQRTQQQSATLTSGEQLYLEWKRNLLSTPQARSAYQDVAQEVDLLLELVEARLDAGLTQAAMAACLQVPQALIEHIEECGFRACPLDVLQRYADAVGRKLQVSLV